MAQTTRRMARRGIAGVAVGIWVASALAGCGMTRYQAKVMIGETGLAIVVGEVDSRLIPDGIGGVEVQVTRNVGMGTRSGLEVLASGISEADGTLTLSIPNDRRPKGPVTIRTGGDQIYPSSNTVYLPRSGERLLVLVRPRAAKQP